MDEHGAPLKQTIYENTYRLEPEEVRAPQPRSAAMRAAAC